MLLKRKDAIKLGESLSKILPSNLKAEWIISIEMSKKRQRVIFDIIEKRKRVK